MGWLMLALVVVLALVGAGVLAATRLGRDNMFVIPTATQTPRPELAFFPAVQTPDAPQNDNTPVADVTSPAPASSAAVTAGPAAADTLAPAVLAQYEGRYEDAADLYRDILQRQPDASISAEAQWQLGVVLYDAGQYDDSITSFGVFARDHSTDSRAVRAAFWAARGHAAAGRPAEALAEFQSYAPNGGPLTNTALLLAAQAAGDNGQNDVERQLLQQILASAPLRLDKVAALEQLALLEQAEDHFDAAGDDFTQMAAESRVDSYRATTLLKAARSYYEANQDDRAATVIVQMANDLPDQYDTYSAVQLLLQHDSGAISNGKIAYDRMCRIAVAAGAYSVALNNCEAFRAAVPAGPARVEAAWYTALAYDRLGKYELAAQWYQAFAEVYPDDARADDALLGWGKQLLEQGDNVGAVLTLDKLLTTYPNSELVGAALDNEGIAYRRNGDLAGAGEHWRIAAATPGLSDDERARALFWWGWALQQQGQSDAAAQAWRQGASYTTFWGFRSADHLSVSNLTPLNPGISAAEQIAIPPAPQLGDTREQALYSWVSGWSATDNVTTNRVKLIQNPEYQRALGLSRVEMWGDANSQYDSLIAELSAAGDNGGLTALMLETERKNWPWISYRAALALAANATEKGVIIEQAPTALLRCLYPLAWEQSAMREARNRNIDPLLLLGIMRQESAYNPYAQSGSAARGLLQIIPGTASDLAAGLGIGDFKQADLFRPATALRFGATYLNDVLTRFDNNLLYSIAGYNSGPGNIPRWSGGRAANDIDLFVENIDYPETRDYLERVYSNYRMYQQLYETPPAP